VLPEQLVHLACSQVEGVAQKITAIEQASRRRRIEAALFTISPAPLSSPNQTPLVITTGRPLIVIGEQLPPPPARACSLDAQHRGRSSASAPLRCWTGCGSQSAARCRSARSRPAEISVARYVQTGTPPTLIGCVSLHQIPCQNQQQVAAIQHAGMTAGARRCPPYAERGSPWPVPSIGLPLLLALLAGQAHCPADPAAARASPDWPMAALPAGRRRLADPVLGPARIALNRQDPISAAVVWR